MPDYWLDSNIFITSKNGAYAFDIAPGFWKFIDEHAGEGKIATSTLVYDELVESDDELAKWAKARRNSGLFIAPDRAVQSSLSEIADYVKNRYESAFAGPFLARADPWLIAHARAKGGAVVTYEVLVPENSKRPKIPNVCRHFRVPCGTLWEMLRRLGASFG